MNILRRRRLSLIPAFCLLVTACGGAQVESPAGSPSAEESAPDGTPEPTAEAGPEGVLNIALTSLGNEVWNPIVAGDEKHLWDMVGDTLIRQDRESRELIPGLAESWDVSDDGLTWTFILREDVPFHDEWGTVTADDVKFTWSLYLREDAVIPTASAYRAAVDGDMDNFEVVSDTEFRIHSTSPQVTLPLDLADGQFAMHIQSEAYWTEVGEDDVIQHPIGTGPFRFLSHSRGDVVTVEAVPDHWRQTPAFETVNLYVLPDASSRLARVQSGDIDLAPLAISQKPEAEAAGLATVSIPGAALAWVVLGGMFPETPEAYDRDAPWIQADDPEQGRAIREAMTLAIDREAIVDRILLGEGEPAAAPIAYTPGPYAFVNPDWEVPPFDPDEARRLLIEGGYPDGFSLDMPLFPINVESSVDIGEAVATMWEDIGLTVNRQPQDFPTMRGQLNRQTQGMAYVFANFFYDEPLTYLKIVFVPTATLSHLDHPKITEYVALMAEESDTAARMQLAQELGDIIIDERIAIPVASANGLWVTSERIEGWDPLAGHTKLSSVETIQHAGGN